MAAIALALHLSVAYLSVGMGDVAGTSHVEGREQDSGRLLN